VFVHWLSSALSALSQLAFLQFAIGRFTSRSALEETPLEVENFSDSKDFIDFNPENQGATS